VFCIAAVTARTARKYGARAERYAQLEAGHVAQNLLLMAVGLGFGGTPVGAFDDDAVARTLNLGNGETPLYLLPIGLPSGSST
jgi:SagB-type dehydrogenase family enzyme